MATPNIQFTQATRKRINISMLVSGISGSGKSFSAMSIATAMGKTAVIDTEGASAEKYAELFDFYVHSAFTPKEDWYNGNDPKHDPRYIAAAVRVAASQGFQVVVVDSLTSSWDWVMRYMDNLNAGGSDTKGFRNWDKVNPIWAELTDLMQSPPIHIFWTARSKMTHAMETDANSGRTVVKKLGLEAILRPQTEFYPDITAEMHNDNGVVSMSISKSRCLDIKAGDTFESPGGHLASILKQWADTGVQTPKASASFSKAASQNLSPDERFEKLADWFHSESKKVYETDALDIGVNDVWTDLVAAMGDPEDATRFFSSIFQDKQVTPVRMVVVAKWLSSDETRRNASISNWRASSYGQINE